MDLAQTKALLNQFDVRPTRSLGQNFLVDGRVVERICTTADLNVTDLVIEIGPGVGHLTHAMSLLAGRVIAIEIDRHVLPALESVMQDQANFQLVHADALSVSLSSLVGDWPGPVKVVANLPYYITSPLMLKIVRELPSFASLVLMLQREAAERIMAEPGQRQYGPLGIIMRCLGTVRREMIVPASSFFPQPHVDSVVLQVIPGNLAVARSDWPSFFTFVESCFSQRRKTLANSLRGHALVQACKTLGFPLETILAELGLVPMIRAEAITPTQFVELYYALLRHRDPTAG
jgi:16S rRNA (adenine1518-N6/adenine1519-N6)-dimethyltransferase